MPDMRRLLPLVALTIALSAAACGSPTDSKSAGPSSGTTGPVAAATASPTAAPATPFASLAPDDTVWLCKPGIADNPCEGSLDATSIAADGTATVLPASVAANPPVDCFYVYPTVSGQTTANANLAIEDAERSAALAQAAQFSQVCHVYAPMYRQLTLAAIETPSKITLASALIAYGDVYSAFESYLTHYNHGRGIVFIGHSQGAMMLIALLRAEVDARPANRKLLVSALLMGGNVTVPVGKSVGGDFANIPACASTGQVGCVVAYSSFDKAPAADAEFGRVDSSIDVFARSYGTAVQILCVNPASPAGGTAALSPYFPTDLAEYLPSAGDQPTIKTAWVAYPNLYSAHCQTSGGATWLQIDRIGGSSDGRPSLAGVATAQTGLHVLAVNLALGNLVDIVRSEEAAFR